MKRDWNDNKSKPEKPTRNTLKFIAIGEYYLKNLNYLHKVQKSTLMELKICKE